MDVRFPDVSVRRLRYSALVRERGGVGYYPTSATPFVHLDTGRVRHWPRMGRYELALLFPNGRTRHRPRTGGPITREDVRVARAKYTTTATRIAAFHSARRSGQPQTVIAAATAPSIGPFQTSITRIRPPQPVPAIRPPRLVSAPASGRSVVTARARPDPGRPSRSDPDCSVRGKHGRSGGHIGANRAAHPRRLMTALHRRVPDCLDETRRLIVKGAAGSGHRSSMKNTPKSCPIAHFRSHHS